jgi:hypothetical protein
LFFFFLKKRKGVNKIKFNQSDQAKPNVASYSVLCV